MKLAAGYRTFTGYVMTQADADAYNRHTVEVDDAITKAGGNPSPLARRELEFRLDQRHRLYLAIAYS